MQELVGAMLAVVVVLVGAYFAGKRKKQNGLARALARPGEVARLYLRADADVDGFWLQAQLAGGKKLRLAAPWELEVTLARLAAVGLQLSAEDQAALLARQTMPADPAAAPRAGRASAPAHA